MLYYVYFSNGGVPVGGLSPTWTSLQEADGEGISLSTGAVPIREVGSETSPDPSVPSGNGWYYFDLTFGQNPWTNINVDLVGVIDGGNTLANADRYKPICVSLRGMGLSRTAHKGIQQANGDIDIFKTNSNQKEMKLDMTVINGQITRTPTSTD